ncbi:hypothetical protein COLO4_08153 [Corchorus olitorius]|uniref:Uncharacterized protein n=1 Tax=Corchorus olitorius TaxID=93759 RepID=A0A1R3KH28_9ROSI|nr:hypothetical protein COLO4_08153 [Corchorus olitorius]
MVRRQSIPRSKPRKPPKTDRKRSKLRRFLGCSGFLG